MKELELFHSYLVKDIINQDNGIEKFHVGEMTVTSYHISIIKTSLGPHNNFWILKVDFESNYVIIEDLGNGSI
ncbi:MAG TPA: hypothetical protein VI815_02870 [Candidatus Nanoarchaeia archaeon]|nr:hypothetical protein [Candidatus Nanoarchaeia archaeon]